MTKGTKIAVGVGVGVTLFGVYWFRIRNRRPSIKVESIDWLNKKATVKFGNFESVYGLNGAVGGVGAGSTYSNKYTMEQLLDEDTLIFKVINTTNQEVVEQLTVDFKSKLVY